MVTDSAITDNEAVYGAAVFMERTYLAVEQSRVESNTAIGNAAVWMDVAASLSSRQADWGATASTDNTDWDIVNWKTVGLEGWSYGNAADFSCTPLGCHD